MARVSYSSDVKWAVVKEKLAGELTNKEIMEKYGIKNRSHPTHLSKQTALTEYGRSYFTRRTGKMDEMAYISTNTCECR